MKRLTRSIVLRKLMRLWVHRRPPATATFITPIRSIEQTFPIRVVRHGEIEDGSFIYKHSLN